MGQSSAKNSAKNPVQMNSAPVNPAQVNPAQVDPAQVDPAQLNPVGLDGFEFVEYCGPKAELFETLFSQFGFSKVARHKTRNITLYRQNDVNFVFNAEKGSFAE